MSRPCSICTHPERLEIDRLLLQGTSYRDIAGRFGLSKTAISRHKESHIGTDLRDVREVMVAAREEALSQIKAEEVETLETVKAEIITETRASVASRLALCKDHFDQLRILRERAALALETAEGAEDVKVALQAIRELKDIVRLWAELEGRLQSQPQINLQQVNIYQSPAWANVGLLLARILEPYPSLRTEVAAGLIALQEGQDGA